ncbi:MAG: type III secretion chaperone [Parachlamydiales bacterium]|nr:type III secretion chaperone [Verrucomicrobiota bacterium]MBX3719153.1 type III secretion chaperone [Candidatus Acheromyda pituitae]
MSNVEWLSILGWGGDELEDLRFVGYSYIKQGKYDIATTFFEALVILDPNSSYDLQTLGALFLQRGNNLMALNYIEKALRLDPTHVPTLLNRTKALFALGYKKQGLMQARSLQKNPNEEIANQAQALILAYS